MFKNIKFNDQNYQALSQDQPEQKAAQELKTQLLTLRGDLERRKRVKANIVETVNALLYLLVFHDRQLDHARNIRSAYIYL